MSRDDCPFCDLARFRKADIYLENDFCAFFASRDDGMRDEAGLPPGVLPGSGVVVPIAHRRSPFELSEAEWAATRELLIEARAALHEWLAPDGYTLGWNDQGQLHAHLHVLPRFRDEPLWEKGVRSAVKGPENHRPDPWRSGGGRACSYD
jgi:hypothetical protein